MRFSVRAVQHTRRPKYMNIGQDAQCPSPCPSPFEMQVLWVGQRNAYVQRPRSDWDLGKFPFVRVNACGG